MEAFPVIGYVVVSAAGKKLALEHTSKGYMFGVNDVFYTVYKKKEYAESDVRTFNRRGYKCRIFPVHGVG